MTSYSHVTVFDLDKTLLSENISYQFGMYLYRKGYFRFPTLVSLLFAYGVHTYFRTPIHRLHLRVFHKLFHGREHATLESLVFDFLQHHLYQLVNEDLYAVLHKAQQKGHRTLLLSSSPHFLVRPIAEHFLFDEWQATEYLTDDSGCYHKVGKIVEGKEKGQHVLSLMKQKRIPKSHFTAYSDSIFDLPLLEVVGNPIAVNPDPQLRTVARERGWHIYTPS